MSAQEEASARQNLAAAERVRSRIDERQQKIEAIAVGQLVRADEPIRIAARIDRLTRYYPGVRLVSPSAIDANDPGAAAAAGQYRGVPLPRQFWKVVTMVKQADGLSALAYLVSNEQLINGLKIAPEASSYGAYRVPMQRIEALTGVSFGSLTTADPLAQQEASISARELRRPEELLL